MLAAIANVNLVFRVDIAHAGGGVVAAMVDKYLLITRMYNFVI